MKKTYLVTVVTIIMMFLLTGCTSVANEKKIQSDLEAYSKSDFLKDGEKIDKVVIDDRQTDKAQRRDTVWCTVTVEDSEVSCEKSVALSYGLYDKNGWMLEDVTVSDESQWRITPLKGIAKEKIVDSLNGKSFKVDGESWDITKNAVKKVSVDKQDTDLKGLTDTVTVTLTLDDAVEEAKGQLIVNYTFDDEWVVDSVSESEKFTATVKPDKALDVTEDNLIEEIMKQEITFGQTTDDLGGVFSIVNDAASQTISLDKDEISDFVIENQETSQKGCYQTYQCGFTVTKPHAVFDFDVTVPYYYGETWDVQPLTISAQATSVDIEGEWTGTYDDVPFGGSATLNISKVDEDGTVTGVYSYKPSMGSEEAGSYNVSGKIDMSTLQMYLSAGSWIEESGNDWEKMDISAILYVDEGEIRGSGQMGNSFAVKK